jgi:TonB-dependent starch-binding outer membrane protein SusC
MRKFLLGFASALLLLSSTAYAQERTVSGKVSSAEDGSSLPGVNVVIKGTTAGTVTDADGNYKLNVPLGGGSLVFSFIGLQSIDIVIGERSVVDVSLALDVTQLSEVVVTGYGTTLKKEFSGVTSTVNAADIAKLPILSASQALQGQAAGVFVTQNSGAPGGGISVRVRGQTSINASNDPLYVIDGVPVIAGDLTQNGFGGQEQSALAGINPNDIASMEVLKDASSAAIYGSRAANGVVLITTKRGQKGGSQINLTAWTGWSEPTNTVKPVSAQQWIDVNNEARANDGLPARVNFDPDPLVAQWGWDGETNVDWVDEIFRTARTSEYQLNISGGDQKTRYYFSGSYWDEDGVIIASNYKRGTLRLNLDHQASKLFSFGTSLFVSSDLNNRIQNDNNIYGIYSAAILTPSYRGIRDENGEFIDALPGFNTNAVRDANLPRYDNKTNKFIGNVYTNFNLLEGLDFRTDFSMDYNQLTEDHYNPATTPQGRPEGNGNFEFRAVSTWIIEPTLRYSKKIADLHSINAVAGMTFQDRKDFRNSVVGVGFARETLTYLNSAATISTGGSFRTDYKFNSVFGRLNYSYNEKYLASVTVRQDGSSRFGANNKFATFYAASLGWNFSEESFMDGISWLDLGKLRASYGTTGNDGIGNFPWQAAWTGGSNYIDQAAFSPTQIANPDLKWETTATLDVGIEMALFQSRLNLNVGYFDRKTTDLLYTFPLPQTTGFTSVFQNVGEMSNKGLEIDISGVVLNTGGFKWNISANGTFLKNEVVKLVDNEPILQGFASAIIVGQPLNTFYGLKFLGVDPANGQSIFEDVNGDGSITTTDDNQIIGDAQPDFIGGFTNQFTYKGFSLDVLFQFVQGVDIYNNTQQFSLNPGNTFGLTEEINRRWKQPGDVTDIPRASTLSGLNASDNSRFLSDGAYLRMKNIALAYDLPSKLVSKAKLRSARIFVTGQNLLTFTGYSGADPEISVFANTSTAAGTDFLTQPQNKMYSVGVTLGF